MKQVEGFWLPDKEEHLVPFLVNGPKVHGGPTYQYQKLAPAIKLCKQRRRAVDVGAHCGLWSRVLAYEFAALDAFEPVAEHRDCFKLNVLTDDAMALVTLHPFALGDHFDTVTLHTGEASSGDTYVQPGGEHTSPMQRLDQFHLMEVDFLKIDCEGYEKFVLLGGEQTIRRDKPVIIVEQKPGKATQFGLKDTEAVDLLIDWGAKLVSVISGDYIMRWE